MIVVLTYDHPHRKTQDVLIRILALGLKPLVVATEWKEQINFTPIIAHRLSDCLDMSLSEFCKNLGLALKLTTKANLFNEFKSIGNIDLILLSTGNIIDNNIVASYKVVNSHPGYLPVVKGLDALKWAILYDEKIGVTSHFVNQQIDGGVIIEQKMVPLYYEDTFHSFAYRQYEMEVDMLVNAIKCRPQGVDILERKYETFRRMPHRLENRMLEKFEERRKLTEFRTGHFK